MNETTRKRSKAEDRRPARARYWSSRTLEKRKVRNLVRCCGLSPQDALDQWHSQRKGRVPGGWLR